MKILFICKHNRGRSKVAEAIFNKLNKNRKILAESAGLIMDDSRPYIAEKVLEALKEKGYNAQGLPRQATKNLANKFDVIVIVADNIEKGFFHDAHKSCKILDHPENLTNSKEGFLDFQGKIIKWNIKDCDEDDAESIKRIIGKIEKNVRKLILDLKNTNS